MTTNKSCRSQIFSLSPRKSRSHILNLRVENVKKSHGLLAAMTLVLFTMLAFGPVIAAAGQYPLAYAWAYPSTGSPVSLASPVGKVVVNVPNGHNRLLVTVILQGASASTTYAAGFNIFGTSCPSSFGVPIDICQSISGSWGGNIAIYPMGAFTTDENGDGSFHINLNDLPAGTYSNIIFWVIPCSPPGSCGYTPTASTGSWGVGPWVAITIP